MILLELFSGIGGARKGFEDAGFKFDKVYFSEIDKYAISVYQRNYPDAEYIGAVESVSGIEADIITFGSPCQDFSVAGKRAGLKGQRSSLIGEAIRLVAECRPDVFVWENVKGTFSSNAGADFWAIIKAFIDIGGYRLEWQLLNTSWFLPQNRERIYLVGYTPDRCGGQIFPIGESDQNNDKTRPKFTDGIFVQAIDSNYFKGGDGKRTMIGTWRTHNDGKGFRNVKDEFSPSIPAREREDGIMYSLDSIGQHKIEYKPVLTPDREKRQNGRRMKEGGEPMFTLTGQDIHGVAQCIRSEHHNTADVHYIPEKNSIRRLTPTECERLQGFPDDWTKYGKDGEAISDTQRYKMLGNAMSVPVVKAVAEKINQALEDTE